MAIEGVDYSFSKPTPAQLKAAGKRFACRYIGTPASGKNLTKLEADALRNAGVDVVANYEAGNAGWMEGGFTVGVNAAKAAHQNAVACGMPPDRPIYFSCDFNATFDQYKNGVRPCLQGCASVLGKTRVGIYGGLEQVDWAYGDGVAPWVWQTYAWSFGQWSVHGHIQQYRNGVPLGSGTVDLDRAVQADFGQWDVQGQEVDLDAEQDRKLTFIYNVLNDELSDGTPIDLLTKLYRLEVWGSETKGPGRPNLTDLAAAVAELKASGVPVDLSSATPEQLDALASGIAAHLLVKGGGYTGTVDLQPKPVP